MVSSIKAGNLLLQLLSGGSSYSQIQGILNDNFLQRAFYNDFLGGHYAETWVNDVVKWANSHGIDVYLLD